MRIASAAQLFVLLASVGTVATAADAPKDKPKSDQERLQGTWIPESKVGAQPPPGRPAGKLTFEGDKFNLLMFGEGPAVKGTFKIDAGKTPKTLDMTVIEGEKYVGKTSLGIYTFDGEKLKWCSAEPGTGDRPKDFATENTKFMTLVFNRSDAAITAKTGKTEELKALDAFLGTWDTEFTLKPAVWTPKEIKGKGSETLEWVLDGRFVQGKSKDINGPENLFLIGYDEKTKEYRFAHFSSQGYALQFSGQWDAAAKTFTWKGESGDGVKSVGTTHFVDADTREFRTVAKDGTGKVYFEMEATLKRRK